MTTSITPSANGYSPQRRPPTGSVELPAGGGASTVVYDLRAGDHVWPLREDEFTIDAYLQEPGNAEMAAAVDAQGQWVADMLYPGEMTLATLRLRAGLSQRELGQRCGALQPAIARWEAGSFTPGLFTAEKIAHALGVSLEQLVAALKHTNDQARP